MVQNIVFERIVATARDVDVSFLLPDGSTVDVPQDILSKSSVLHQTICTAEYEIVDLTLPKGFLTSWLHCIDALMIGSSHSDSVKPCREVSNDGPRLLEFLKMWNFAALLAV